MESPGEAGRSAVIEGSSVEGRPSTPRARKEVVAPSGEGPRVVDIPETLRYRLKNRLLGPAIASDRQATERLGRPTALAVLSSDVISSSAYATEEMLITLVTAFGVAAYTLVVPVTFAVIGVLLFVTLSYLEVVKVYTKAGGAYVVARENFGLRTAQIAAMALLVDYTLTVAVSVAAGVAALSSVFPALAPHTISTLIGVALVLLIAYGNLRGIREAGRTFAVPTYFFVANMVLMIAVGIGRIVFGSLHAQPITGHAGAVSIGRSTTGLLTMIAIWRIMTAFANGGSALTGTEAISNGVAVFRRPESRNARITMIWMATILGSLVLAVSTLASQVHPIPYVAGTPTVLSQIAKVVYGTHGVGGVFYVLLQASTMLILVLAANTSFTGFPYLASFAAEDSYLPRQLTKRGHRLVFSTGIAVLTVVSIVLLVVTDSQVDKLIPLYAIGVFTGFTMAGAGMARYHLTHREEHWRRRLAINGSAAVLSAIVLVTFAATKFTQGAWVVLIILPVGVFLLIRLNKQYMREEVELEQGAVELAEARPLPHNAVIVMVDRLDTATARALQYARTLHPDQLRAVHFAIDPRVAAALEAEWSRLGLTNIPLDVVECSDRRLVRSAVVLAAEAVAAGDTELTVLLPRRGFSSGWKRLLHDRSADQIAEAVSDIPHVSATIVPTKLTGGIYDRRRELVGRRAARGGPAGEGGGERRGGERRGGERRGGEPGDGSGTEAPANPDAAIFGERAMGCGRISEVVPRRRARLAVRIKQVRVQPKGGTTNLELTVSDGSGSLLLVFQGRRHIAGFQPGARLVVEGMVGSWGGRQAILNPDYEMIAGSEAEPAHA